MVPWSYRCPPLCHSSHFSPIISTSGAPSWLGPTIWGDGGDQEKLFWLKSNREVHKLAAWDVGLPSDMVPGCSPHMGEPCPVLFHVRMGCDVGFPDTLRTSRVPQSRAGDLLTSQLLGSSGWPCAHTSPHGSRAIVGCSVLGYYSSHHKSWEKLEEKFSDYTIPGKVPVGRSRVRR